MKKYIITLLAVLSIFTLCSCGGSRKNDGTMTNDMTRAGEDMKREAYDMGKDAERFADDMTNDTIFDTDHNYNVDRYSANGDYTK